MTFIRARCAPRALAASLATSVILLTAVPALAQAPAASASDLANLTLEQLLEVEVVSAASKFAQPTTDAPASVSIVTAEDIRRFGYRTLPDVLRSIRGLYVTYDRNYTYLGMRGFARPGDYNTRVLLLIDGHRINDPVYDMAPLGTDFPVDISLIDRIEVIRGPASAMYGTSAFLGVINVVTRTAADRGGLHVEGTGGSQATRSGRLSFGHIAGRRDLLVSASGFRSDGAARLYFPEFDTAETNGGIAAGIDGDRSANLFASASLGRFSVRAVHQRRDKEIPTAAWGAIFGDAGEATRDERSFLDLSYGGPLGAGWNGTARAGYDRMHYRGVYPFDYADGAGRQLWIDEAASDTFGGELTMSRSAGPRHFVTVGSEVRRFQRADQWGGDTTALTVDDQRQGHTWAAYVQDDIALLPRLALHAGVRVDYDAALGFEATPRVGLVYRPMTASSIKVLHGSAFRAPNFYERYYYELMRQQSRALLPERITTDELIWEQDFGRHVRTAVNVYHSRVANLITSRSQVGGPLDGTLYFENVGKTTVLGLEAELEVRWASGASLRLAHAATRARDGSDHQISNSPARLGNVQAILPLVRARAFLAFDGQYVGPRLGVQGGRIDGYYVQNVTVSADRVGRFDLALSLHNLFGSAYSDPGSEEHLQQAIPQDGRTVTARVAVRF